MPCYDWVGPIETDSQLQLATGMGEKQIVNDVNIPIHKLATKKTVLLVLRRITGVQSGMILGASRNSHMESQSGFGKVLEILWDPQMIGHSIALSRESWPEYRSIVAYRIGRNIVHIMEEEPDGSKWKWEPTQEDILADDWRYNGNSIKRVRVQNLDYWVKRSLGEHIPCYKGI